MRTVLVWGLIAGLVAGLLALAFAYTFGEPPVELAISLEEHDHGAAVEVSRGVQRTIGLAIATCALGLALGGLFALAFAFAYGRLGSLTPRATAWLVAGIAFVSVSLVPFLTYPPNPPGVGRAETIGDRTALYFTMVAISVALAVLAIYASRRLGVAPACIGYAVAVAIAGVSLPHLHEVPPDFPAQTLWDFRLASLGTQAVLWGGIGLVFAILLTRSTNRTIDAGLAAG
jgi:predicted cobalt transporter CbtA